MKLSKLLLSLGTAAVLLAALTASASAANSLSTSHTRMRGTWTRLDFSGGFGTIECEVTLEGTFHARTMPKVANSLLGYVTAASVRTPCRRGEATILRETLPWHVTYVGFTGTLPTITTWVANVIGLSFRIREPTFGAQCLARSTAAQPGTDVLNRNTATGALTSATVGGEILCRGAIEVTGRLSGTSNTLTNEGGTAITVTLI